MTKTEDSEANQTDCRLGICFRPKWARRLASPRLLTASYGFLHLVQGMLFLQVINTMTTFEKHFQLKSETLGQVLCAADIVPIIISVIFSYWRGAKDRPRWMGGFSLVIALGCFINALPYFIFGAPDDQRLELLTNAKDNAGNFSRLCVPKAAIFLESSADSANSTEEICVQNPVSQSGGIAAAILLIGLTTVNIGTTVLWIVGTPYLDDSMSGKNSPFHIAIISALRTIGPMFGALISSFCLSFHVNLSPTDVTPHDPRWIGAWWLGYVIIAPMVVFAGSLLTQFPVQLPSKHTTPAMQMEMAKASKELQIESTYDAELSSRWEKVHAVVKDFCHELWSLLKNRHWFLRTASGITTVMALESYMIYFPKYLEHQFRLTASEAGAWSGTAILIPAIIGELCMGFLIKLFAPSSRKLAVMLACSKLLMAIIMFSLMFMQCGSSYIVGIHKNSECDVNCECPSLPFQPVCVDERQNVLSGCHAGCTSFNASTEAKKYVDCSCSQDGYASPGFCSKSCSLFPYYIVLTCLGNFILSVDVASIIFLFRCVPMEKKTLSLGIFSACMSLFAFSPAPMIFSVIVDATCALWNMSCGVRGACLLYDIDMFRHLLHGIPTALLCVAFICDFSFAMKAHEIDFYGEDKKDEPNPENRKPSSSKL